jgi:DNA-binding MarR family transcriptional regulator
LWLPVVLDDRRLDAAETLLLVGLAEHVNDKDECFVGITHLAARARCSYATAKRRLDTLAGRGVIARERNRRDDGNLSVYTYRLERSFFGLQGLRLSSDHGSPR